MEKFLLACGFKVEAGNLKSFHPRVWNLLLNEALNFRKRYSRRKEGLLYEFW